jgi:hypothetical protein
MDSSRETLSVLPGSWRPHENTVYARRRHELDLWLSFLR